MMRFYKKAIMALALALTMNSAPAMSFLGPFLTFQTPALGYNPGIGGVDLGGPQNLGEEYRWNLKTVYYGFDSSFKNYFGEDGMNAVRQAIAMMNSLPPVSQMSADLSEFALNSKRANYRASALGLLDMKSATMGIMLEEMGMATPERWTWCLRNVVTVNGVTYYTVIMRNFDPVTTEPSEYVNGNLYTYSIFTHVAPAFVDAVEIPVDPLAITPSTVVSSANGGLYEYSLLPGDYFIGLTADDAGCLRYLLSPQNYNVENLLGTVTLFNTFSNLLGNLKVSPWAYSGSAGLLVTNVSTVRNPWGPATFATNVTTTTVTVTTVPTNIFTITNVLVATALRPGVDHIQFVELTNDSELGGFVTASNYFTDTYVTNSTLTHQQVYRLVATPDILFLADDLGLDAFGNPLLLGRDINFVNNAALNGVAPLNGPGNLTPQVQITFSKLGPYLINFTSTAGGAFLDQQSVTPGVYWGSFDGTTNEPIIYPSGTSIQQLEQAVLSGQ